MKYALIVCFLFLSVDTIHAQHSTIERLKTKLRSEISDTARCKTLDSLSMYTMFFTTQLDSTLSYCNENINAAFSIPDKKYLILAYTRLGFYYSNVSLNKECLNITYKGLDLSETNHIQDYLSALYYDLGWFYLSINNSAEALAPVLKGISYLKYNKDPFFDQALHLYGMAGGIYQDLNKADSVLYYFHAMDSIAAISTEQGAKVIADYYWAQYYLWYKNDNQKGDSVCAEAIAECRKTGHFLMNAFYTFLGNSSLQQGKMEKALSEAKEAYAITITDVDRGTSLFIADLLSNCYGKLGKLDSAYHYLKVKDSLNSLIQQHSDATEIQQFEFNSQIRKREQEAATILQTQKNRSKILSYVFITAVAFFLIIAFIQWRNSNQKKKANRVLQQQKQKIESTLQELKSTQAQLIQSEKMASLGELTAGIAHEIQNPLNFVNNFSDINTELVADAESEIDQGNIGELKTILNDIKENEQKINHHGKRADAIVKSMLQHSRASSGTKEPTDINALADEYLRLAYAGFRTKEKSFQATLKTDYDESIAKLNIVSQDVGRVFLNMFNNAFYAIMQKKKLQPEEYIPTLSVTTKKKGNDVIISIRDNGSGIPEKIKEKIFQPFFTSKPAGQGTGLGLSLSYDTVKAYGGDITVNSTEGEFTEFLIQIPLV